MALFSKLFGKNPDFPPLEETNPATKQLAAIQGPLRQLAGEVSDPLEVVPSEGTAYVFVGKPPKKFGLAWIHDGCVSNFKTLMKEKGVRPSVIEGIVKQLTAAYESSGSAPRYVSKVGDKQLVVTPSDRLRERVHEIMESIEA